jgi:hypothetical protein
MISEGSRPPPAVCAFRNDGIAAEWPSEVPPANDTTPNGNRAEVPDSGALDHASLHVWSIVFK